VGWPQANQGNRKQQKNIQKYRRAYTKGTVNNKLYKEMGNSIYGNVVIGMSNKLTFDTISGNTVRVRAS
jgi:hypothetical protein